MASTGSSSPGMDSAGSLGAVHRLSDTVLVTVEGAAPTGRRGPRHDDTRERILAAAGLEFASSGFEGATVRSIASRAGVTAAMINHYFGGKDGLFREVTQLPYNPTLSVTQVLEGPREELGRRVALSVLAMWDDPQMLAPLLAQLRSQLAEPSESRWVSDYFRSLVLPALAGSDEQALRDAALLATHLLGIVIGRHVLRVPELTSPSVEELADRVGPVLQAYISTPV